jgi:hypothetical protein
MKDKYKMSENRLLKRIIGPKRGRRKLQSEELRKMLLR